MNKTQSVVDFLAKGGKINKLDSYERAVLKVKSRVTLGRFLYTLLNKKFDKNYILPRGYVSYENTICG